MQNDADPFQMLFRARWNVPQAAAALGFPACEKSWEWVKVAFRDWCVANGPDYGGGAVNRPLLPGQTCYSYWVVEGFPVGFSPPGI